MHPKDAEGIANSVHPEQTAPAVWSGSALFAQTYLSENFRKLRYKAWTDLRIPPLSHDNVIYSTEREKAEIWNKHFTKQTILSETNATLP